MRLAPWLPFLAGLGALPACASNRFDHCNHEPAKCKQHARKMKMAGAPEVDWPTCPVRAVIESDQLRYVRTLDADLRGGPVHGWPSRFAAWVPRLWRVYRAECEAADAAMAKRQSPQQEP